MKFMVFSLPRSRSKWLSEFLSYDSLVCGHDLAAFARGIEDLRGLLAGVDGSCETGAVAGWKLLRLEFPQAKFVVVKRPLGEIVDSIRQKGWEPSLEVLEAREEMLELLSKSPRVKTFWFADLAGQETCREIFEFTTDLEFDPEWWSRLSRLNIQIDFDSRMLWLQNHSADSQNLFAEVAAANARLKGTESCLRLN